MSRPTVVILSRSAENLAASAGAVATLDPELPILVVDDGLDRQAHRWPSQLRFVRGRKPFCFSRNANLGIRSAAPTDVVLLNDDALLQIRGGFSRLAEVRPPEYGLVSAAVTGTGNRRQQPRAGSALRDEPRMVCFVAVLIPRATIETVGLLDERYVDYGCEDDDYCLRVRRAGLKIGIYDGCKVDHESLPSTYRGSGGGDYRANLARFVEKWGHDNRGNQA